MKAIINGITIEGTPDEIRQAVNVRKYNWTYRQGLVQAGRDAKMLANSPSMPKENGGGAV